MIDATRLVVPLNNIVNIAIFLRTPILKKICERLLDSLNPLCNRGQSDESAFHGPLLAS